MVNIPLDLPGTYDFDLATPFITGSSFGFFIDNWFSIEVQQQQPAVVPEPSTWITGITGVNFLAVGAFWFRRRSPAAMSFHST
jgi:hypothetical protein